MQPTVRHGGLKRGRTHAPTAMPAGLVIKQVRKDTNHLKIKNKKKAYVNPRVNTCATHLNQKIRLDSVWEWLCPFCSKSQVGSLKEPKPVFVQRSDWELP